MQNPHKHNPKRPNLHLLFLCAFGNRRKNITFYQSQRTLHCEAALELHHYGVLRQLCAVETWICTTCMYGCVLLTEVHQLHPDLPWYFDQSAACSTQKNLTTTHPVVP